MRHFVPFIAIVLWTIPTQGARSPRKPLYEQCRLDAIYSSVVVRPDQTVTVESPGACKEDSSIPKRF